MGAEATCTARFNGKSGTGKARLETDVLQFRGGDVRLAIPFAQITKVSVRAGTLRLRFPDGAASFDLGPAASKWAEKIQHPPSRLDKIGVKPHWRVSVVGVDEAAFLTELKAAVAELSVGRFVRDSDAIFFGATTGSDLQRLATRWPRIVDALNVGYAAGNVALSVGWLLLLHHRGDQDFRRERTAAMVAFAGALPVYQRGPSRCWAEALQKSFPVRAFTA
jgi:hypothetical protein